MTIETTGFEGLLLLTPSVFADERGYFFESYNSASHLNAGLDVVVDLRKEQPTYGKSFSVVLTAENKKQLLVPKGFAHGFSVLSASADVMYKCDALYNKQSESGLLFNDPTLKIDWKLSLEEMIVSEKDLVLPTIDNIDANF